MSFDLKADHIRPPRASQGAVLATSTTRANVDLRTVGQQTKSSLAPGQDRVGLTGKYVRIWAVDADCYVAFGPSAASVNAIVAVTAGTNQTTFCAPIYAGTYEDFELAQDETDAAGTATGPETFLGYVTRSGAGFIVVAQSSP